METQIRQETAQREGTVRSREIKGKLVEYLWHLKKKGYSEATIKTRVKLWRQLVREGCNLLDPEAVKTSIATHNWSNGHKQVVVQAYQNFMEMLGRKWNPPRYRHVKGLPFIPLEEEINALIAGCSKKIAASLLLMKETGMRIGEVWKLQWIDVDDERKTIRTRSEKHGNPRMFKVTSKLVAILNALPKSSEYVFGGKSLGYHRWRYDKQRRRLAVKLQNPRLLRISFHTFRHWKATMEYNRTKDILYVKQLLGHRNINSTLTYTQLVSFESDEYHVRVARNVEQDKELIKAGFEYVTDRDGLKVYRKRK